jgi:hypothetical protein
MTMTGPSASYSTQPPLVSLDEHENGSSSSTSSPEGATPLQEPECDPTKTGCSSVGNGIDFIETILSKIFGCNRLDPTATLDRKSVYDDKNQSGKEEKSRCIKHRRTKRQPPAVDIPTPPVIRRLALPDEQEDPKVERDQSLNFLFQE